MRLEYSKKTSFLWGETFFQRPPENFLWTLRISSRYLEGANNPALCISKKSWPHDTSVRLYISKRNNKNLGFWKNEAQNGIRQNILTKPHFLRWNFLLKGLYKIFCEFHEHVQGIWKVRVTLFFAWVKISWPYNTPIKNINKKPLKNSLAMKFWVSYHFCFTKQYVNIHGSYYVSYDHDSMCSRKR